MNEGTPKTHAVNLARKMEDIVNKKIWDLQQAKKQICVVVNSTTDYKETFDKLKYFGKQFDDACCDLQSQSDVINYDMVEWFVHEYCEWKGNKPSYDDLWTVHGCQAQEDRIAYVLQDIEDEKNNVVKDEEDEEFAGFKDKDFI